MNITGYFEWDKKECYVLFFLHATSFVENNNSQTKHVKNTEIKRSFGLNYASL